jgi:UDP-glucose:(heptosyl)LPS alpha-1,3-glucosyltransferase
MEIAVPVYEFATTGGVGRYTREVAAELARRGHGITVYTPPAPGEPPPGVRLRPVGGGRPPNSVLGAAELLTFGSRAALRMRLRRGVTAYGPVGSVWMPGVVTAHSVHTAWVRDRRDETGAPPTPFDRALMALEWITWRLPYLGQTAVSPRCADDAAACFGIDRSSIAVVPPAIEPREFAARDADDGRAARERYRIAPDRYVVGIAANYAFERKRVDLLIDATARAGALLMVAGTSDRHRSYYEARQRAARGEVRFLGRVEDMRAFYCALDVFALPSINEAYGMAAHEAMACGVATVVSRRCGIAGLVTPGMHTVVIDDLTVDCLVATLDELRDAASRHALGRRGSVWAHRRTWSDVGAEIEAALVGASGGAGRGRNADVTPPAQ